MGVVTRTINAIAHPLSRVCVTPDLFMDNEKLTGEAPHQPRKYNFRGCSFRSKRESRSFKAARIEKWSLLDYQEVSDSVLCYYCSHVKMT